MILKAFLWFIFLCIIRGVINALRGRHDASATYYILTGLKAICSLAVLGCVIWFLWGVVLWAKPIMFS